MAIFQRRGAAQRAAGMDLPPDRAVGDIHRHDVAHARAGEQLVAQDADAAAEQGATIALGRKAGLPQLLAGVGIHRDDMGAGVDHEQLAAGHDGRGGKARLGRAAFDRCGPCLLRRCAQRQMTHRLGRIAARLRPLVIGVGFGQGDGHVSQGRIDFDPLLVGQDRGAVADHRGLGAALLAADHAAARQHRNQGDGGQGTAHRAEFCDAVLSHALAYPCTGSAGVSTASIPNSPAICRARERIDWGTFSSLAMAANIGPASSGLRIFI